MFLLFLQNFVLKIQSTNMLCRIFDKFQYTVICVLHVCLPVKKVTCFLMVYVSLLLGEAGPICINRRILDNYLMRGVAARRPRKLSLVRCNGAHFGLTEWRHLFYRLPHLEVWTFDQRCFQICYQMV